MSVRSDLAAVLETGVSIPVYSAIFDSMEVPSIVLYPDAQLLTRDVDTFGGLVWHHVATVLVGRNDLPGVFDRTEELILAVVRLETLGGLGAAWTTVGNYRIESVGGVDYVAVDVRIDTTTNRK